jgi:glutaminyl-peptide cyclotransferase
MTKKGIAIYLIGIGLLLALVLAWYTSAFLTQPETEHFDGKRALEDVKMQVSFGPRTPGSAGHAQILEWMRAELSAAGWDTQIQTAEILKHPIQNVVASRSEESPQIILAAHYDTRMIADNDPNSSDQLEPVPGANDGASGVAVLIELARVLPKDSIPVWLVFFDAEDNGRISGWDWILGSQAFVAELDHQPQAVVILDMIGDADLNIYKERTSDQELVDEIWTVAATLGYEQNFIAEPKYSMLDDHTPFLQAGIPAVDIIDFEYPYWHTTSDTVDKVSADSLEAVGATIYAWIAQRSSTP